MRSSPIRSIFARCFFLSVACASSARAEEPYIHVLMPEGIRIEQTLLDGPVFADARRRTLYRWNAQSPGRPNMPQCDDTTPGSGGRNNQIVALSSVPMSCAEIWPPAVAPAGATPVGAWSVITRRDGTAQWAYAGYPVYTFHLDAAPGEVKGGTNRIPQYGWMGGLPGGTAHRARRIPIGPPSDVPPGFLVLSTPTGRQVFIGEQQSVFVFAGSKKGCAAECTMNFAPVPAPALTRPRGDWATTESSLGVYQWTFRGKPLYTYIPDADTRRRSLDGADVPGWRAVYIQRMPDLPPGFRIEETTLGPVMADRRGMTVYLYRCSQQQPGDVACDDPTSPQEYRLLDCGAGDPAECLKRRPYVVAAPDDRTLNWVWSVIEINPQTGRFAKADEPSLRVWAYRGEPIYTYWRDKAPGDTFGDTGYAGKFHRIAMRSDLYMNYGED